MIFTDGETILQRCWRQGAIPKIIMQTWKTTELPSKWQPSQASIRKYMPDWEYVLMTDEMNKSFIALYFPDFLPYYDAFPYPIQRADAIRYAWLYIHGGIYIDCDFELLAALDELFMMNGSLFLLASSNIPSVFTNAFIAAAPGNPIFLAMMEEMKKPVGLASLERHLLVMHSTGPVAFTRVIQRTQPEYIVLPSQLLNPYTICDREYNKPNTLMRPLPGSSWVGSAATMYHWCYCHSYHVMLWCIMIALITMLAILLYFGMMK